MPHSPPTSAEGAPPYMIPGDYNASLGQSAVEFRCVVPSDEGLVGILWFVNGQSVIHNGEEQTDRGITPDETLRMDENMSYTYAPITVEARAENDNITLQCGTVYLDMLPGRSEMILLRVQGNSHAYVSLSCVMTDSSK